MVRFPNTVDGISIVTFSSLWSSTIIEGKSMHVAFLDILSHRTTIDGEERVNK